MPDTFPAARWFRRRGRALVRCAVACCALALAGGLAAPAAAQREPDHPEHALRVMSFNVRYGLANDGPNHWDRRKDLVARTVLDFDPDVLGVQEALGFQVDYLAEHLPGYGVVGVGRDDGDKAGEMVAVYYNQDRLEELDHGHFWLSTTPDVVASKDWDAAITRMVTWLKLRLRDEPERVVFVFNTHFDHVGVVARRESAALLHRKAKEIAGEHPVIITGDFNAPADPAEPGPYRALVFGPDAPAPDPADPFASAVFPDTFGVLHPQTLYPQPGSEPAVGTFTAFGDDAGSRRIDWVLASPHFEVLQAEIDRRRFDGRLPSDHYPVTAVLRLRP